MRQPKQRPPMDRRRSSTLHYQTFPTPPPKSRGRPLTPTGSSGQDGSANSPQDTRDTNHEHEASPLPIKQLAVLAVIALAEQTALNSIQPYLPEMTAGFPEVDVEHGQVGLYVGTIASSFALAQFATNFFWGWLSDRIGRKPVVMLGTLLTAVCLVAFGFCKTLWQAILVQAIMGVVNGNAAVVSTCLGEITDRSNQSKAFVYLPVIYGIGAITGPAVGGFLVMHDNPFNRGMQNPYPYLLPNLFGAALLVIDLIVTGFFLEESLEGAKSLPPLRKRVEKLGSWLWQFTVRRETHGRRRQQVDGATENYTDGSATDDESESQSLLSAPDLFLSNENNFTNKQIFNRDTILLLSTYLIFQLSNVSFNSLYPIFAAEPAPTGRELSTREIGLSLSYAGIVALVFQIGVFGKLKEKMGNRETYRGGLLLFFLSMMAMPWVGYRDSPAPFGWGSGTAWLWAELGVVLMIKTVAAVGGLTSALLLVTNSAPNHSVLGTLNGLAQTLSAGGRAVGPVLSGGLFSAATNIRPKGEAFVWGILGGIAFVGWVASLGIRGEGLESAEWVSSQDEDDEDGDDDEESRDVGVRR